MNTIVHNNKISKECSPCICLQVILIDSILNYYTQCFQKNVNFLLKKKKMEEYITSDIKIYPDSDREDSNEENFNKEN